MENQTSFDLNQNIQNWRDQLGQSSAFRGENLNELESHLRDSIGTLEGRGLSAEEAFMVAVKRAGTASGLAAEFGKVNGQAVWIDRMLWMLIGLQLWGMVDGCVHNLSRPASLLLFKEWESIGGSENIPVATAVFGFFQMMALAGSLGICWWLTVCRGQAVLQWLGRKTGRALGWRAVGLFLGIKAIGLAVSYGTLIGMAKISPVPFYSFPNRMLMWSQNYSSMGTTVLQAVTLLGITILLARKRLALVKAG